MHLYNIFIFLVVTLINIYAKPVLQGSVYENLNISISDLKCSYLQTTKLFEPQPPFLSSCTDFSVVKSLTAFSPSNVNQALCLLYYNGFVQLCRASTNLSESFLKASFSNEIIDRTVSTYQKDSKQMCKLLENNQFITEDAKPGIDKIYKYLKQGECLRICTDFDENINPACILTAFMIDRTIKLQSPANYDPSLEQSKETVSKNKPNVTVHMLNNNVEHLEISHGSAAEDSHSNKNPVSTLLDNANNLSLKNNLQNIEGNQGIQRIELPSGLLQETLDNSSAKKAVTQKTKISQDLNHDLNSDLRNLLPTRQSFIVNTDVPLNNVLDESIVTVKQNQDVHMNNEEDTSKKEGIKVNQSEIPKNIPVDQQNVNNADINRETEIKPGEQNDELSFLPNLESPAQANGDKKNDESNSHLQEKVENNKSTTKNVGDMDLPPLENEPDDVVIDKDPTERDEQDDYDESDPKFSEVKTKSTEKGKPSETIESGPNFPANYQNQNIDDSDSYFFSYFMMVCIMFICAYVAYHNKQKILALVVEGRKGRRPSRTRRPNSANYRKLDSNLEEAVTSSCNKNATHVIY